ncbi:RND family transporter [Thermoproteota archaeon]
MISINKFSSFVLKNSLLIVCITTFLTLGSIFFVLPKLEFDNSVDVFFDKNSRSYLDFQEWKDQFGSDQVIIVAFSDEDIFTENNLALVDELTGKFEMLPYVDNVRSITNVNDIIGFENDFIVESFVAEIPSDKKGLASLRKRALENPLYRKDLISQDAKTTALIVELEKKGQSQDLYKKETIEEIANILKQVMPRDKKYHISGLATIEYFYAKYMQDDFKNFIPFIVIVILAILFLSFRRIEVVFLPLLTILVSLVWTMAFLVTCGLSINNVTTIIPPIMLAIAVADSIHFVGGCIKYNSKNKDVSKDQSQTIKDTIGNIFVPCLLTTLTTAVGFFSLTVSKVQPVRELGFVVGVGVFFAFIVTFVFLPAIIKQFNILSILKNKAEDDTKKTIKRIDQCLARIGEFSANYHSRILLVTCIIAIISIVGLFLLKTETSVLEYFKKESPVYSDTTYIEKRLSGVHFLNISLRTGERDYFREPDILRRVEDLQKFLDGLPEVDKTTSVVDYIKEINKSFHNEDSEFYRIPNSRKLVSQYLLLYGANDLDDFVNMQWNWTTIRVRLNEHTTTGLRVVLERIEDYLDKNFESPIHAESLGQTILEVESNEAVTKGQIYSLGLAMLVIFAMMFIVFRSFSFGVISIIPNILPLLINFGIMGFLAIRLNSATSMISAIGIGIIVDDTIHFMHRFKRSIKEAKNATESAYETISDKGRPVILTSIILFFGFGIVSFSRFVPTSYFGILSALLMFNALWADLIVLPSVLIFKYGHRKP